jgi:predicted GH43/DUF377 family glycosyl hydrolase
LVPWVIAMTVVVLLGVTNPALAQGDCHRGWTKYAGNPVLEVGEEGEWDRILAGNHTVRFDGSTFHMWYAAQEVAGQGLGGQIGYATSSDGVDWAKYAGNPVLERGGDGEFDEGQLLPGSVIFDGYTYTMWYTGFNFDTGLTAVGVATSPDGVIWTKYAGNPVLTGDDGTFDEGGPLNVAVVFDGESYRMWFTAGEGNVDAGFIGHATSADGITWTKHPEPVLEPGASGAWDADGFWSVDVIFDGSDFHMWYDGGGQGNFDIGYATSSDGVTWTKGGGHGGPVLRAGYLRSDWDSRWVFSPRVAFDDTTAHMWFMGVPHDGAPAIGYATASLDHLFDPPHTLNDNRFAVSVYWWDADGNAGEGVSVKLTDDSGYDWFFDPANIELVIKVLDGCAVNGHYWVFAAGLTNVGVSITVTDTATSEQATYLNTLGEAFQPIQDNTAFAVCE